ncbi:MAG: 1-deoxy-D-xylulose-5-phosphate synthase [Gleimia sp.]|jgi:1-deoxy-D-xylulose-5-phosphate synthase|nr:1-deoxy-D-xylulose-5-phosphate synthase [Acidobacteriota bacterium]
MDNPVTVKPGKLLASIKRPADIRALTSAELIELAAEIREYLVQSVSRTGGHLGPNLGVVELTLAIHRVFDSPRDAIVFDTGHQAYVHKLLTGRTDFSKLRQEGGLSGYPSRAESKHDIVENSHASTALSWAEGIMREFKRTGREDHVVAVIGDGALTGGLAWEAINNIGDHKDGNLVIIVNDNGRSYAPTIGGLAHHLDALRMSEGYEKALAWGKKQLLSRGKPGEVAFDTLHGLKEGMRDAITAGVMFADLGIKYVGPIDGHDEVAIEFALTRAKAAKQPILLHVITQKGRGYTPAEEDVADRFHAVGKIHPETGLPVAPSRFGWTAVFADEIVKLAKKNPKIVGITAAMMAPVGLLPLKKRYPDRVIDVGIAEQHAVTSAAGMAYAGAHPVFAVYSTFLNRAFDQVLMDVALHKAGVTFVLDRAGITGDDGPSHNGMWDIAMLSIVPGLRLAAPRDEETLRLALREATAIDDAPTVVRYPKGALPKPIEAISREEWGDVLLDEDDAEITILATGSFANNGLETARKLAEEGYRTRVIDPRWLLPVTQDLVDQIADSNLIVTFEDGLEANGFGAAVRDALAREGKFTPVMARGIPKQFLDHAKRAQIIEHLHLDVDHSVAEITELMESLQR